MKASIMVFCGVVAVAFLYCLSYRTATLVPITASTYNLNILGLNIPYSDTVRKTLPVLFAPLRTKLPTKMSSEGTLEHAYDPSEETLTVREPDGTLRQIIVPPHLKARLSTLKKGTSIRIIYGFVPDKEDMFCQRFQAISFTSAP